MLKAFYQELQAKTAVQVQTIYTYRAYLAVEDQKVVNSCTVVLPEGDVKVYSACSGIMYQLPPVLYCFCLNS